MKRFAGLALALAALSSIVSAQTPVSGNITTTTWTTAGSPYTVTANATILAGNTLTIDPGVEVLFAAGTHLYVQGDIQAVGTGADSIWFRGDAGADWYGFVVTAANGDTNRIAYAQIRDVYEATNEDGGAFSITGADAKVRLWNSVILGAENWKGSAAFLKSGARMDVNECLIRGNRQRSTGVDGGAFVAWSSCVLNITDSVIDDCDAFSGGVGGALYTTGTCVVNLTRTLITNCLATYGGVHGGYGGTTTYTNCTVANNSTPYSSGTGWGIYGASGTIYVNNSIFWGNNIVAAGATIAVSYSDIQGGWSGTGNINADPLFVDAAGGDYSIPVNSPCVDAGDPVLKDPDGTRTDMGAYPYTFNNPISGSLTTTTWTTANSPYQITGNVTIEAGHTLTIEAGVDVIFNADVPIYVNGAIHTYGTVDDSVRFITGTATEWDGIRIQTSDSSSMAYTRLSGGAYSQGGALNSTTAGARIYLSHSVVDNNGRSSSTGGAVFFSASGASFTADDCVFVDNIGQYGGAIYGSTANFQFTRCLFVRNIGTSIAGAFYSPSIGGYEFRNCTFTENASPGGGSSIRLNNGGHVVVRDCILWNPGGGPSEIQLDLSGTPPTADVTHSDVYGGWAGTGNIDADPMFVNPFLRDYTLQLGSPCINAGDPAKTDPDGTRSDMGPFPYNLPSDVIVVNGTISGAETWLSGNTYRVNGPITVAPGAVLTIQQGVDVLFDQHVPFNVTSASVFAHGVEGDSVRFMAGASANWMGIRISATNNDSSYFSYTAIRDGYADDGSTGDGAATGADGGAFLLTGDAGGAGGVLRLSHCVLENNTALDDGGAILIHDYFTLWAFNCVIRNNTATSSGGAIHVYGELAQPYMQIGQTVFEGNSCTSAGSALRFYNAGVADIVYCTFADNSACRYAPIEIGDASGAAAGCNLNLSDCILWNPAAAAEIWNQSTTPGSVDLVYCDARQVDPGVSSTNGISADPMFVDAPNGDYSLQLGSPCINAADPNYGISPDGTRADIGAFQYTIPAGTIVVNGTLGRTTWATGDTIRVNGTLTFTDTLTIEAGVDVLFDQNVGISTQHPIFSMGTEADSVRFQPGVAAQWNGIEMEFVDDSSYFDYTAFRGAHRTSFGGGAIYYRGDFSPVGFSNCVFEGNRADNNGGAVDLNGFSHFWFYRCTFIGNTAGNTGGAIASDDGMGSPRRVRVAVFECLRTYPVRKKAMRRERREK